MSKHHQHHSRKDEKSNTSAPKARSPAVADKQRSVSGKPPTSNPSNKAKSSSVPKPSTSPSPFRIKIGAPGLKVKAMIKQDNKRQRAARKALSGLRRNYMMAEGSQDVEMDFLNILHVDAFGDSDSFRVWVDITLGDDASTATEHEVLLDIASALTWVSKADYVDARTPAARQALRPPADQRARIELQYASSDTLVLRGELYQDTLRIGSDRSLRIDNQLFAVIDQVPNRLTSQDIHGILGCGPRRLSRGTIVGRPNAIIDTVIDNMITQRGISAKIIGIALNPPDDTHPNAATNALIKGTIHFGGTSSEYPLENVPTTQLAPASSFYGVNLTLTLDSSSGGPTTIMSSSPGIIDTGAPLISLKRDYLRTYMERVGAAFDNTLEVWCLPISKKGNLRNLNFYFEGGAAFVFPPSAQVWPPNLNTNWDSRMRPDYLYFTIRELDDAVPGKMFILGLAWIQRYYVGIDSSNPNGSWIRIARTRNTNRKWVGL